MIPICHVQVLPLMSGCQRSMIETLRHLDRNTFEPHVVCQSEGLMTEELARREIPCHIVPELCRPIRPWKDASAVFILKRLFRRYNIRLVHNQTAKPRVIGTYAAKFAGVPSVVNHVRGYPFHSHSSKITSPVYRRIEAAIAKHCDQTVFVNNEDRELALAKGLVSASRCVTIYNGADLSLFATANSKATRDSFRSRHGIGNDEVLVTFLARLDTAKQPLILPKIAAALDARNTKRPWRLLVAGDGETEFRVNLKNAIAEKNVQHCVQMIGWQTEVVDVLHATDIILQPSLWEGLPRTLIEAHAAGVPCVASDARGCREVISEATGRLVSTHDVSGYAAVLSELIDNPFLRRQLGLAARRRAEDLFDTVENNRQIVSIYCDLLDIPVPATVPAAHAA